ncbi:MAG: isocitrate/isopropylmalate family dehydrogenase, partial [Candidatus Bathyarchaeia archaeon]
YKGLNKVNPIATIMASKMMLEWLGSKHSDPVCIEAAKKIEAGVFEVLKEGKVKTYDFGGDASTSEMAEAVAKKIIELG